MKVLNLRCAHDHRFEGWFASEDDYQRQQERGLVECPLCADKTVTRLPSAPRLNVSKSREVAQAAASESEAAVTLQSVWLRAVQHVMANSDNVGPRFAEEARRIHYGEAEERAIHGQASREDAEALADEGIEVLALPVPEALKGPIQ